MADPEFVDFDPKFDMRQMAEWMINAADYAEIVLHTHPKLPAFCRELRQGAASIAMLHGQFLGGLQALLPVTAILPEAITRREFLRQHYATSRAYHIERLCQMYAEATIYYRQVQHGPGRPKAAMPDYEALQKTKDHKKQMKMLQYSYEFAIAIQLVKRKKETGHFSGLNKLLTEHMEQGLLDDVGDTAQRIKRLARNIHRDSPIYLSPGLHEARATAQQFIYSLE